MFIFDNADGGVNPLVRLRLIGELGKLRKSIDSLGEGAVAAMNRLRLVARANEIRIELGGGQSDTIKRDSEVYQHQEISSKGARQKANDAARLIVDRALAGDLSQSDLTEDDRRALASYSGSGGSLLGADGKKGSAYEYYTPTPVAAGVWDALKEMGFSGGKVLDPSSGTGVFGATAPGGALVDSVELDKTSGTINGLLNDGPQHNTTIAPFERVAAATEDGIYDAVVTNVPFGTTADRGGNQLLDTKYRKDTLESYFILRSLDKLKPGGLAAFIVPPRCTTEKGGAGRKLRERASLKAEFIGAYRLPNKVFGAAAADTITDVIFFRKYSADAAQKIDELLEQDPAKLSETKVLWGEYLDGNYFKTSEGIRHILGEFKAKDPEKFRDVDRVENPASVPEIAKLLRKLPDSRIDWNALNATETMPVTYQDGDTVNHGGQILEYQEGEWVAIKSDSGADMSRLLGSFKSAFTAYQGGMDFELASAVVSWMRQSSHALDIPSWLASIYSAMERMPGEDRNSAWRSILVAAATDEVLDENGRDSGTNYLEKYPALSVDIKKHAPRAKTLSRKLDGRAKSLLSALSIIYKHKTGYSPVWRGDVASIVDVSGESGFEGLKYKNKDHWVSITDAKAVLGDDFDPMKSDDWCLSADGQRVAKADDYYIGNLGAFNAVIDDEIAQATDVSLRNKLLRQKSKAADRVDILNPDDISHNLFSPYVTMAEKLEFLQANVHESAHISYDNADGKAKIDFDMPGKDLTDKEKLIRRFGIYLSNRSATLGTVKLSMSDKEAISQLQGIIKKANVQFDGWVKSNRRINDRLASEFSNPGRLRFRQTEDEDPLSVPGMHPDFVPHGYQNSFARKMGQDFSGINGFGPGLGKTFTALLSVQHVQSIGAKKKTIFVVPNSVLSNWRKEVGRAYQSTDDCLFVGLREDGAGGFKVRSTSYDEDLHAVLENRHRKIFMTMEAFERLRLKDATIEGFEAYLRRVDESFGESEDKKKDVSTKGKVKTVLALLSSKTGSAPYIEDLGIDSIVMDEAHSYKNSATTVDFKSGKYLSLSGTSNRGLDAQAKCWHVRGLTSRGDGVIELTATPLTNSPLESYSMLSLASGHERVNDMFGGIAGADAFMNAVCDLEDEEDVTIDGKVVSMRVFKGLNNAPMLRKAIHQVATIKDANDVGAQVFVPDAAEQADSVGLTGETVKRLELYKDAYRYARDKEKDENLYDAVLDQKLEGIKEYFSEPDELIAHPFNLISKMTALIADPDLDKRLTRYVASSKSDAERLVSEWATKNYTEEREKIGPNTTAESAISSKAKRDEDGNLVGYVYKFHVRSWLENDTQVCIDTTSPELQDKFEAMAEKIGIDLDVTIPPKLATMLKNFQAESATPRGLVGGKKVVRAKQIIFCDILAWHNKIRLLLSNRAGVQRDRIAIITGKRNNSADDILAIQDGFNAEDAKYQVVIANKKAEVGINLQVGTQAIHHLTIGWTPDSITQRNGRGVRQGNKTDRVSIYFYDADGTFDEAKRTLVNSKASWIDALMDIDGSDKIEISGGMSREKMEALIDVIGDKDGATKLKAASEQKEAEQRIKSAKEKQQISLDTVSKQNEFLDRYSNFSGWVSKELGRLMTLQGAASEIKARLVKTKSDRQAALLESRLTEVVASISGAEDKASRAASITDAQDNELSPGDVIARFLSSGRNKRSDKEALSRWVESRYRLAENQESELYNDWLAETEMSKQLKEEAVKAYERQAGGLPVRAASMIAEGKGRLIGNVPVFDGCILVIGMGSEEKPSMAVYQDGGIQGLIGGTSGVSRRIGDFISNGAVVAPEDERYDDLLDSMAEYEDRMESGSSPVSVYSEHLPEVAKRRKVEALARYYVGNGYLLPSPYFPLPVPERYKGRSALVDGLINQQRGIIKQWVGDRQFAVSGSVDLEKDHYYKVEDDLISYARANEIKIGRSDPIVFNTSSSSLLMSIVDLAGFESAVSGAATLEELRADAVEYLRGVAGDVLEDGIFDDENSIQGKLRTAMMAASDRIRAANKPKDNPMDMCYVSNNPAGEYLSKDEFRQRLALVKDTSKKFQPDYAPQFRKLAGGFSNVWVLHRGTVDKIHANNPGSDKYIKILGVEKYQEASA